MNLLLDKEWWGLHDQIGPSFFVLSTPYELGIEIAVAAFVGNPDRAPVVILHHGLILGGGDVLARSVPVPDGGDLLSQLSFPRSPSCHNTYSLSEENQLVRSNCGLYSDKFALHNSICRSYFALREQLSG